MSAISAITVSSLQRASKGGSGRLELLQRDADDHRLPEARRGPQPPVRAKNALIFQQSPIGPIGRARSRTDGLVRETLNAKNTQSRDGSCGYKVITCETRRSCCAADIQL